jgi:Ca-activated chloride channel family protein
MTVAMLLLAFSLSDLWQRVTRDSNSHAVAARGVEEFAKNDYAAASQSFGKANALAPTAANAFNLGTSQVAAGKREEGSATLQKAMNEPHLRADALYNRGNSALAAKAYDYAVRDYIETLKLRPSDAAAKRNLEIALRRKAAAEQSAKGKQQAQGGGSQQKQPQPSNGGKQPQQGQQPNGRPDAESLLRSVQQQEQEELARMHRPRATNLRVGW